MSRLSTAAARNAFKGAVGGQGDFYNLSLHSVRSVTRYHFIALLQLIWLCLWSDVPPLQTDVDGRPYVEAVMPLADWHGSRAYIQCTRAIRQVFEETKDIQKALDAPKEVSLEHDLLVLFSQF